MLAYLDTAIGFVIVMLAISLLITILTQMVSALVNHRGSNLHWGLKVLFANIDRDAFPQLTAQAADVSRQVLTHCLVSDSWFSGNRAAHWFAAEIPLLRMLFDRFQLASAIRPGELTDILDRIASALPAAPPPPAPVPPAAQLRLDIRNLLATSAGRLESWFGSMMDRVSQKFATYMRLWTVAFACTFALVTGLNTLNLAGEIYRNGLLRDALVGASQQVTAAATTVLDPQNSLAAKYSAALQDAVKGVTPPLPQPPPPITTTAAGIEWIEGHVPEAQRAAVRNAFNTAANAAADKYLQDGKDTAGKLVGITSQAGIQILKFHWPPGFTQQPWRAEIKYLIGVFLTAALLSLGAPFWFNALKSLANLRPILASKQQAEQEQAGRG
ncbi:MAG: hypothetical protein LAP87_16320 [Acidobacteriia bacterium]|nr:hypothetical protein [Terriglobia bacterium]